MLFRYIPDYTHSIYQSDFIVSSSMKPSLWNSMEKSIPFCFNTEIPGTTFPVLLAMNPSYQSICGTLSGNIIVRVVLKSKFLMNQTLQRHGGMFLFLSLRCQKTNILDIVCTSRGRSIPTLLCSASLLVRQGYGNTTCQKIPNGHSSSLAATEYSKCI